MSILTVLLLKTQKNILCLCLIIGVFSCRNNKSEKPPVEEYSPVEVVLIEFYPSFIEQSMVMFDFSKNQAVFKRIGPKKYYSPRAFPVIEEVIALKTNCFQLDSADYYFLKDSVRFGNEDFIDRENLGEDGSFTSILYVLKNGEVKDVDLTNSITNAQQALISRLIDSAVIHATDSASCLYFKKLKKYYQRAE